MDSSINETIKTSSADLADTCGETQKVPLLGHEFNDFCAHMWSRWHIDNLDLLTPLYQHMKMNYPKIHFKEWVFGDLDFHHSIVGGDVQLQIPIVLGKKELETKKYFGKLVN